MKLKFLYWFLTLLWLWTQWIHSGIVIYQHWCQGKVITVAFQHHEQCKKQQPQCKKSCNHHKQDNPCCHDQKIIVQNSLPFSYNHFSFFLPIYTPTLKTFYLENFYHCYTNPTQELHKVFLYGRSTNQRLAMKVVFLC